MKGKLQELSHVSMYIRSYVFEKKQRTKKHKNKVKFTKNMYISALTLLLKTARRAPDGNEVIVHAHIYRGFVASGEVVMTNNCNFEFNLFKLTLSLAIQIYLARILLPRGLHLNCESSCI